MNKEIKEEKKQPEDAICREKGAQFHRRNWLRHYAMVPKGFLRYHVLEALNSKPMSGSELMDEIQKGTDGAWKPSPGSIYPLLAWLQDNDYVKELPTENGFKRYQLTQNGKDFLEEQIKIREKFRAEMSFMTNPFFEKFSNIPPEKIVQIRATMRRLLISSVKLGKSLREKYSEKNLNEALKILDDASQKLEEMNEKLKAEKLD
jgi:DNA-binding PadR family transcriptional regulator